ncbi:MAG: SRPBCC domain-containing protein [Chryseolinea sp.]
MKRSIKHQFFFPHPVERVWEYLTKPELMELWLMKNDFQPTVGVEFRFTYKPVPSLDFDGIFYCKVLEVIPNEKLSYTWACGPGDGKISLNSVVVWTLSAVENGTELVLDHSGFEKEHNLDLYTALMNGWVDNVNKIIKHLSTTDHVSSEA